MSEKVILPREVAEAIEGLRSQGFGNFGIIGVAREPKSRKYGKILDEWTLNSVERAELLVTALVNGYDVVMSKEDRVLEYYRKYESCGPGFTVFEAVAKRNAISKTLNLLGITIEGINGTND